jgi:excisionase family DNA binding protein
MTASATKQDRIPPSQEGSNPARRSVQPQAPLLGVNEVASWLGVEVGFIRRLIAERRIPFVKIGKYVRFDSEEIAAWIDRQRVHPDGRRLRRQTFGEH